MENSAAPQYCGWPRRPLSAQRLHGIQHLRELSLGPRELGRSHQTLQVGVMSAKRTLRQPFNSIQSGCRIVRSCTISLRRFSDAAFRQSVLRSARERTQGDWPRSGSCDRRRLLRSRIRRTSWAFMLSARWRWPAVLAPAPVEIEQTVDARDGFSEPRSMPSRCAAAWPYE